MDEILGAFFLINPLSLMKDVPIPKMKSTFQTQLFLLKQSRVLEKQSVSTEIIIIGSDCHRHQILLSKFLFTVIISDKYCKTIH